MPLRPFATLATLLFAGAVALAQPADDKETPAAAPAPKAPPDPTASAPAEPAPVEPAPVEPDPADPAPADAAPPSASDAAAPADVARIDNDKRCLRAGDSSSLARTLRGAQVLLDDSELSITAIVVTGSSRPVREIWRLVHDDAIAPERVDGEVVSRVIVRLMETGLFATITPTLKVESAGEQATARVELQLVEHPQISRVDFSGLRELEGRELLRALVRLPGQAQESEEGSFEEVLVEIGRETDRKGKESESATDKACPSPLPPPEWLARIEDGELVGGILWGGVEPALERVVDALRDEGYEQASLSAELRADGSLAITVDEGTIRAVEVRGVHPAIEGEVLRLLSLEPGAPFFEADLEAGVEAVAENFPFLSPDHEGRQTLGRSVVQKSSAGHRWETVNVECIPGAGDEGDDGDDGGWRVKHFARGSIGIAVRDHEIAISATRDRSSCRASYYQLVDGVVIVHFQAASGEVEIDGSELFRHTPVTGYAPGLDTIMHKWDAQDRIHLHIGASLHINTGLASRAPTGDGYLDRVAAGTREDHTLMVATEFPGLMHTELGVEAHSRTDTADRWRMSRNESHAYSMIINRPEAEYYRRTGASVFATVPIANGPTLGAEYRYDLYGSLDSVSEPYTWFRQDEAGHPNPAIDEGRMGSGVLRLEWGLGSLTPERRPTAILRRYPEVSLYGRRGIRLSGVGFRTMNTLELSREALGSNEDQTFTRFITDNLLHLPTADRQGLSIRGRVESVTDGAPGQKEAALGGWGSLRGYQFKRFRGRALALMALEYHFRSILAFVDFGAVREAGGWTAPGPGIGASLLLADEAELSFAWRTDEDAKGAPNVRLLFGRQF